MLVLTRKKGQFLNIGDNIRLVVLEISGDTVRLGIEAPLSVAVYRGEVYRAIQEENRAALASSEIANAFQAAAKNISGNQDAKGRARGKKKTGEKTCLQREKSFPE